jgi:hypothetical protein
MANENEIETVTTTERVRTTVDILKPETCPPALKKFYTDIEREAIKLAIEAGNITSETREVKVSKEKSGTGQEEKWPYVIYRAVKGPGMTALARGRQEAAKDLPDDYDKLNENQQKRATLDSRDGACDYFNYGFSLTLMQPIRVMLTNSLGGVEKEIEKQIAQVMKTGLFTTADSARAFIIKQREEMGMEIPAEVAAD